MSTKFGIALYLTITIVPAVASNASIVPPEVRKSVAFIYGGEKGIALGTGFFIGAFNQDKSRAQRFFVTAKHVLRPCDENGKNCSWQPNLSIRFNLTNGDSEVVPLGVVLNGPGKTIYLHSDPTVDLAVIPISFDPQIYDHMAIASDLFLTSTESASLKEGMEVFFSGLFAHYPGYRQNYPISRFGRIALLTSEKIHWGHEQSQNLLLLELSSFGGNSGAPVFLVGDPTERGFVVSSGGPKVRLIGVMKGTYRDVNRIAEVDTAKTPVSVSSMGIAAVVPIARLSEILSSKELAWK